MRVADRQVVQPALDARVAADREVRLIAVDVERAAVDAADAQPRVAGFARRQRHRQVVLSRLRPARAARRGPRPASSSNVKSSRSTTCTHVGSRDRKGWRRRPHRLGRQRIVVARNEEDRRHEDQDDRGASLRAPPRSPVARRRDRRTGRRRTGRVHALRRPTSRIVVDHIHPRARQLLLRLLRERRESPPEVPVRGVQQSQHDVSGFGGAIRNDTWNSRVTVGARYRSS